MQAEELVPGYLALMEAPPVQDAFTAPSRPLGWRPLVWVAMAGLFLGAAAYLGWAAFLSPLSRPAPLLAGPATTLPSATRIAPAASVDSEPATGVVRPSAVGGDGSAGSDVGALALVAIRPPESHPRLAQTMSRAYRGMLRKAWSSYSHGNLELAASLFGRAIHLDERQTAGYYGLALVLFEQGAEDAALTVLERGSARAGAKHDLWLLAGSIYQWKGHEAAARDAYQRYLQANPRGAFSRDVRALLSYPRLPALLPFDGEGALEMMAAQ